MFSDVFFTANGEFLFLNKANCFAGRDIFLITNRVEHIRMANKKGRMTDKYKKSNLSY